MFETECPRIASTFVRFFNYKWQISHSIPIEDQYLSQEINMENADVIKY